MSQPLAEFPFVNNRCLVWRSEKISDLLLKVLDWPTNFPIHLRIHSNKLPSYLIYHNGTQDLGLNFVLCKTIKNVFFYYYYNCNLIQGICEIYQQLPYYAVVFRGRRKYDSLNACVRGKERVAGLWQQSLYRKLMLTIKLSLFARLTYVKLFWVHK